MLYNKKIGVGIVTCNREHFFKKCYYSLPFEIIDELIVVNDGKQLKDVYDTGTIIHNKTNVNVGACKNIIMTHLLNCNCDYIFTLEDDIIIKDKKVFENYVKASAATNIQHFNFGFSQRENLDNNLQPIYRKIIDYGQDVKIVLTKNILGAFTFYTKNAAQTVGLHHYMFNKGHGDHLELTYRAFKHKLTTPFWWFADIYGSWNMIENQSDFITDSVVRNKETFVQYFNEARDTFKMLHGLDIFDIPDTTEHTLIEFLKQLKNDKSK